MRVRMLNRDQREEGVEEVIAATEQHADRRRGQLERETVVAVCVVCESREIEM